MKKTLLLFFITLACFSLKAQQTQITITSSVDPIYANDASVTITAQGENNNLAVDMDVMPYVTTTAVMITPNNQGYANSFFVSNIARVSYYNGATGSKSSFTAKINTSGFGADATVKFIVSVTFINISNSSFSTGTVPLTVNIKPGSRPATVYSSAAYSKSFTRNNCAAGYQGTSIVFDAPAGHNTSTVSQAAANQAAVNYVNANGQNFVNTNGGCNIIYSSVAYSGSFTRNNCGAQYDPGAPVAYALPAGSKTSIVSQADANAQALALFNTNGQNNANASGACVLSTKTFISFSNQAKPGSTITRLRVYSGNTLVADFNEAQLLAGPKINPGTYNFIVTTVGPVSNATTNTGWATLELSTYPAPVQGGTFDNNGTTTNYTFNNITTASQQTLHLYLYFLFA
jgi:hypothetical protein